jgi:hypothetical protein
VEFLWENDIKVDPKEIVWDGKDCRRLAPNKNKWRAVVNTVMNLNLTVTLNAVNVLAN